MDELMEATVWNWHFWLVWAVMYVGAGINIAASSLDRLERTARRRRREETHGG